jgi:hypothetical protein
VWQKTQLGAFIFPSSALPIPVAIDCGAVRDSKKNSAVYLMVARISFAQLQLKKQHKASP